MIIPQKSTARSLVAVLALLLAAGRVSAFQWPSEEAEVSANFLQYEEGEVSTGLELLVPAQPLLPIEPGEIVYRTGAGGPSLLPRGEYGDIIVVEHQRGLRSVYGIPSAEGAGRLAPRGRPQGPLLGEGEPLSVPVSRQEPPGGDASGRLYLSVIDTEMNQLVNPQLLLTQSDDKAPPEIGYVAWTYEGRIRRIRSGSVLPAGFGELRAAVTDPVPGASGFSVAPFKIQVFINGELRRTVTLDYLKAHEGRYALGEQEGIPPEKLYDEDGAFRLGEYYLSPGEAELELDVSDAAGNRLSRTYRLRILE